MSFVSVKGPRRLHKTEMIPHSLCITTKHFVKLSVMFLSRDLSSGHKNTQHNLGKTMEIATFQGMQCEFEFIKKSL